MVFVTVNIILGMVCFSLFIYIIIINHFAYFVGIACDIGDILPFVFGICSMTCDLVSYELSCFALYLFCPYMLLLSDSGNR